MSEFLIIRHGQSQADLEKRYEGRADFPLTELGREQARKAAKWIGTHFPPQIIYASPLKRAAETAQIIADCVGLPVQFEEDLMEWNNGVLAGMLFSEADIRYPYPKGGRKSHECVPGGETDIAFRARAESVWAKIFYQTGDDQRVAIVAHEGSIAQLFQCFLKLPMQPDIWLVTGDTGMHLWKTKGTTRWVLFSNFLEHLREEQIG